MPDTINGKTPDEIKKGLEVCGKQAECNRCGYFHSLPLDENCVEKLLDDALACIKQLERERDEAIADMTELMSGSEHCMFCKYLAEDGECTNPNLGAKTMCWEWRGVQEVK